MSAVFIMDALKTTAHALFKTLFIVTVIFSFFLIFLGS